MVLNKEVVKSLKSELAGIEKEISEKLGDKISPKAAAQITNLLDKVETRNAMPDFKIKLPVVEGVTEITLTFTEFLKAVDSSISKADKKILSALEKKRVGLVLLLESDKD